MSIPAPGSTAEAMDMVLAGLKHLAAADPTALAAQAQAECLQAFEQADAISTAARAWLLAAFTTGQGYSEDADYCVLLCSFHHQVVIHRWGWTLVLNPDGTTTAWNPDRTKVLPSHGPPPRAG